jgi:hypothetical protein
MSEDTVFRNRLEALKFLQRRGYKLSKSKLYQDTKSGKLPVQENGSIQLQDLWDYLHGERMGLPGDAEPSPEEKQRYKDEKLGHAARKNRYLSEAALRELIHDKALEWIKTAHGDPDLVLEVARRIEADVAERIERLSGPDNARVIVLAGEKGREGGDNG